MKKNHALWYGKMEVHPNQPIEAGSYQSIKLTYSAGKYGMDNGGRLRLLFRNAWDGGTPQMTDPVGDNYVTATTSNPMARVEITFMRKGGRRPWLPCLVFEVKDDSLDEGDQIFIRFGDTSGGGNGHRKQTFAESDFRWLTDVECFETGTWVELEDCPITPIIASSPSKLVALSPSEWICGNPLDLVIKAIDNFGNPTSRYLEKVNISLEKLTNGQFQENLNWEGSRIYQFELPNEPSDALGGTARIENMIIKEQGQFRFVIEDNHSKSMVAVSNVLTIIEQSQPYSHHWGDLHAQYNNALGTSSVEEAFRYGRDAGAAEFVGHQPNDFQFREEGWQEAKKAVREFHIPGKFIPLLGYEWSGNTPGGGDRNVHFLHDDGPLHRTSHWHVPDKSDEHMDRYPLSELYQSFKGRDDVLLVPHIGGRRCDITKYYDAELEPVIEICSCHGRFEWLLHEAIENGYIVGVVGGSDDHTGRPGAAYATSHSFGTRGGLAGIYAKELSRKGLFDALRARHSYATTGERIWLNVGTECGHMMGDHFTADAPPAIRVQAAGTVPIERVEIMRNLETAYSLPIFAQSEYDHNQIRLEWGGARVKGRGRHSIWNGKLTVEGALIKEAITFAFDHPQQGIIHQDDHSVEWNSSTSGDHDGILLTLAEGSDNAVIHFNTGIAKERFTVKKLREEPFHREYGAVGQYCRFSLQPKEQGPNTVDFTWTDPNPAEGRNACWIRLVQQDGEMAWSSPIYVEKGD